MQKGKSMSDIKTDKRYGSVIVLNATQISVLANEIKRLSEEIAVLQPQLSSTDEFIRTTADTMMYIKAYTIRELKAQLKKLL